MGCGTVWKAVAFLVLARISGAAWGQSEGPRHPEVVVAVYDDTGVDPRVVTRAEDYAAGVFHDAGIVIRWRNRSFGQPVALPVLVGVARGPQVNMRIRPHSRNLPGEVFGLAFLGPDGCGTQADLFYDGISRLSAHSASDPSVLLGAVVAHELGHLLLGLHAHSREGIMRARWDQRDLQQAALRRLGFTEAQSTALRSQVRSTQRMEVTSSVEGGN